MTALACFSLVCSTAHPLPRLFEVVLLAETDETDEGGVSAEGAFSKGQGRRSRASEQVQSSPVYSSDLSQDLIINTKLSHDRIASLFLNYFLLTLRTSHIYFVFVITLTLISNEPVAKMTNKYVHSFFTVTVFELLCFPSPTPNYLVY